MAKAFLRIRPIDGCSSNDENSTFFKLDDTRIECKPPIDSQFFKNNNSNLKDIKKKLDKINKIYEFDKVLDENSSQEQLYNECVQPLLTEFFNGENVLLFAYGTTSSGKTFTMRGNSSNPGVVPRCINDIFLSVGSKLIFEPIYKRSKFVEYEKIDKMDIRKEIELKSSILNSIDDKQIFLNEIQSKPDGFKCFLKDDENIRHIVWCSFFELYNEQIIDLLSVNSSLSNSQSSERNNQHVTIKLKNDTNKNFYVSNLNQIYVNSAEEAMKVYLYGVDNLKKHISQTAMNRTSSRSHSFFTLSVITLKIKNLNEYEVWHVNNFSLCDLAGQERGKKALTVGIHLKESNSINKSLFTLRRCIQEIKLKKNSSSQLIPFKESTLTKVFQPYLSGCGLTFMIITINPKKEHFDETINSLDFCATASQIVIEKNSSVVSLKDKVSSKILNIKRLTQNWLSKHSSIAQGSNNSLNSNSNLTNNLIINETNSNERDVTIIDSENVLNQEFNSNYLEDSIAQIVNGFEDTIVEIDLYDSKFVEDLLKRLEQLEQLLANPEINQNNNLESIHNSVIDIYERHEEEKRKIKERYDVLMDERMKNLSDEHDQAIKDYENEIEGLHLNLLCKENENEQLKKDNEKLKEENEQLKKENENIRLNTEKISKLANDLQKENEDLKFENLSNYLNEKISTLESKEYINEINQLKEAINLLKNGNLISSLNNSLNDQFNLIENLSFNNYSKIDDNPVNNDEYANQDYNEYDNENNNQIDNENDNQYGSNNNNEHYNELEQENKELKALLDIKDEEIKKLKTENQRMNKEINKTIKEEGISVTSGSHARITKNLYTSVLNHTSIVGCNTPYKPLSQLQSTRKRRNFEEENESTTDNRYLDFIKNNEKSPQTEKKTKRKRTTSKIKEEKKESKIREADKIIEDEMDDLIFYIEETDKKAKKSRAKKEITTSVRKKIPLEECRESFIFENDDLLVSNDNQKKRNLRSRKKITYK